MITEDSNSSSGGNRGKWSDRIKKILRDKGKKINNITFFDSNNTILLCLGKIILSLPSVIYTNVKDNYNLTNEKNSSKKTMVDNNLGKSNVKYIDDNIDEAIKKNEAENVNDVLLNKQKKINVIRKIDVTSLKNNSLKSNLFCDEQNLELLLKKENLKKEIIDIIKRKLLKNINELEILQSDLYVLDKLDEGDIHLKQCAYEIKEIKKLLSRIKSLKEKYNYLKDNVDFQYVLQYDDDILIDKILELKDICDNASIHKTVDDYKILNEYKFLYLKIDKLEENTIKLNDYKEKKILELKKRDVDFEKFKEKMYDFERINEGYSSFVKEQDFLLKQLDEKISNIDVHEKITYRLKGFNKLLGNSFKYVGLLLMNPLKGLIPGIVSQTILTKNVIHNLYVNMEWEESKKLVYEAIDYSSCINVAINSLDDTSRLVDATLDEIIRLKSRYKKEFGKYETSFSDYKDAISKLNKIENAVLGSKIKLTIMQEKLKENERINSDKLNKVRKLNNDVK